MKKNKKKLGILIGLAAALLVLVGVWQIVKSRASAYEDSQSTAAKTVFDVTVSKIKAVSFQPSGGTKLSFTRNGKKKWVSDQEPDTTVDQTKVGELASGFTGVTLTKTIKNVTDLSQYGLDKPTYTCSFTTTDGKTTDFVIGSTNDTAGVAYLLKSDDKTTVYAVSTSITSELTGKTKVSDFAPDSTSTTSSVQEAASSAES